MIARKIQLVSTGRAQTSHFSVIVLICAVSFFAGLGSTPLFDRDEGRFSETTREMFERGDFISPIFNAQPRPDKPILAYWMQAVGVTFFGMNEFGVRFMSAVAASLWVFGTYFFARRYFGPEAGLTAALVQATSLFVIVIGRMATADALLNLFLALAFFDAYRTLDAHDRGEPWKWPATRTYLWFGLGFLTKGPIAVVFPLATMFMFALILKRWRSLFSFVLHPPGWFVFAVVALPWYVAQTMRDGGEFLRGFFLRHNIDRFQQAFDNHSGPIYYYVPIAFLLVLPYSHWLLKLFTRARQAIKDPILLYLWLWFAIVFVFFSISSSKLPHYLLYGMTPIFVLMAKYRDELKLGRVLSMLPLIVSIVGLAGVPYLLPYLEPYVRRQDVVVRMRDAVAAFDITGQVILGIALVLSICLLFSRLRTWRVLLAAGVLQAVVLIGVAAPRLGAVLQRPTRNAAAYLKENNIDNVVVWNLDAPSLSFYRERITETRRPRSGEVAVTRIDRLSAIRKYTLLFEQGPVVIVRVEEIDD